MPHPFLPAGATHAHNKQRALIARRVAVLIADGVLPEPKVRDEIEETRRGA